VAYAVQRLVHRAVKKQDPYNVTRCVRGAYVDEKGDAHTSEGPGRSFKEGAVARTTHTTTSCRMVQEQLVKKVQYMVWENVTEECVKKVPYQVCRMVPETRTKQVAEKVCEMQKFTVCKKVPYQECVQQPYTVHCRVPYTVQKTVPCTVTKRVEVCVPE